MKKFKKSTILISIGLSIYILLSIIDRFFIEVDPYLYIPIALLGILFIIFGIIKEGKTKRII